jgi:hypothetical protein
MVPDERRPIGQTPSTSFPAGESIRRLLLGRRTDPGLRLFTLLQFLDILTTLLGFRLGLIEGMWFPAAVMGQTNPVLGLMMCKLFAFGIAGATLLLGRKVTTYNVWFCLLNLWNGALISGRAAGIY